MSHRRPLSEHLGRSHSTRHANFARKKKPPIHLPTWPKNPGLTLSPSPCQLPCPHRNLSAGRFGPNLGYHQTAALWLPFLCGRCLFPSAAKPEKLLGFPTIGRHPTVPWGQGWVVSKFSFWSHRHLFILLPSENTHLDVLCQNRFPLTFQIQFKP